MYMDTPDGQKKVLELLELLGLNEWRNVGKSTEGGILSVSLPRLDREIYIYILPLLRSHLSSTIDSSQSCKQLHTTWLHIFLQYYPITLSTFLLPSV